ncbi:MAG: hypothetical protein DWP94_05290 [Flavobacterium sp.]|nr:MAG: hypothetical protein DWP94_05290 [Flavobacterium sp.]
MVIQHCDYQKFLDYLATKGWEVISNEYWEEHNVVMIGKGKKSFPLLLEDFYYYFKVNKICDSIGVERPPKSHSIYKVSTTVLNEEEE